MTIIDQVQQSLRNWGKHPCFIELQPRQPALYVTADELLSQISISSRQLNRCGITRGCLVPLFLDNSLHFVTTFLGLLQLGAVPVLVKPEYRKMELDEIFGNARPQAVIVESRYLSLLHGYLKKRLVIVNGNQGLQCEIKPSIPAVIESIDDQIASINYTYRGYGYPLGAMIPHDQYAQGARGFQGCLQSNPGDKLLAILPMHHIYTLVSAIFFPLIYRLTSVIARTIHPRMIFQYINEYGIKYVTTVPEIFSMLHRSVDNRTRLASEVFVSGGSILSPDNYERIRNGFGVDLLNGYGLTEFTPATGNIRGSTQPGSIGQPCFGTEIKLNNKDSDGVGEIWIHNENMARGYYRRTQESRDAYSGYWFKTGDLGRKVGDHLVFIGEKKRTRKVNGSMVDLEEVKRAFLEHPNVRNAEIFGFGNSIHAKISLRRPSRDTQSDLLSIKSFLKDFIAEYKIPRTIERM